MINKNIFDKAGLYDENFINSISLNNVSSNKELKALVAKLGNANYIITNAYQTMYNNYILAINDDADDIENIPTLDELLQYKSLASKIQKAYNYLLYIFMFENPFKTIKR